MKRNHNSLALISANYDYSSDTESDSDKSITDSSSEHKAESSSSVSDQLPPVDAEESDSDAESIIETTPRHIPKQLRVKGELSIMDLPPIEDLHISVKEEECIPFGKVYSIVDTLLIIQSLPDKPPLNLESIFFRYNGAPVGRVFDVFGPVKRPFYSVRFNTNEEIHQKDLKVDVVLYAAPETKHTQYVFTPDLMKVRGSDASWVNDCEPPPECIDYSDDEEEEKKKKLQKKISNVKLEKELEDDSPRNKRNFNIEKSKNRENAMRNKRFGTMNPSSLRKEGYNKFGGREKPKRDLGWHNRLSRMPIPSRSSPSDQNGGGNVFRIRPPLFIPSMPTIPRTPPVIVHDTHPQYNENPVFPIYNHSQLSTFNPCQPPPGWPINNNTSQFLSQTNFFRNSQQNDIHSSPHCSQSFNYQHPISPNIRQPRGTSNNSYRFSYFPPAENSF